VALALGFVTAAICEAVGLSLALGAFLAGLLVSESNAGEQTLKHVLPLRDAFVALFFVTMGVLVNPRVLGSNLSLLLAIVGLTVIGKLVVWAAHVVRLFRYPWKTALIVGLGSRRSASFHTSWCRLPVMLALLATTFTTRPWRVHWSQFCITGC